MLMRVSGICLGFEGYGCVCQQRRRLEFRPWKRNGMSEYKEATGPAWRATRRWKEANPNLPSLSGVCSAVLGIKLERGMSQEVWPMGPD